MYTRVCTYLFHRDTGKPEKGYGSVLPHHHPDHDAFRSKTTYNHDYCAPYPYEAVESNTSVQVSVQFSTTTLHFKVTTLHSAGVYW